MHQNEAAQGAGEHRPQRSEDGAQAGAGATVAAAPCSNHGAKDQTDNPVSRPETPLDWRTSLGRVVEVDGVDVTDTTRGGERLERFTTGKHCRYVAHPLPDQLASPGTALVDFCSFSLTPPVAQQDGNEDAGYRWICGELGRVFNIDANGIERQKTGRFGFKHNAKFLGGLIAWGGDSQRGKVLVSLTGEGCARIDGWATIAAWLESHEAKLTRVDLAYDDVDGTTVDIEKVRAWYEAGEFGAGGRQPKAQLIDDLGSGAGKTFYVGKRKNGKMIRGYEKGKQLGDPGSRWFRVECEWHSDDRVLPYAMLISPGQYLAGAYPCLRFLSIEQSKIKTVLRSAKTVFERAMDNARQQAGKLVNLALDVYAGDYGEVVERLIRREGYPKRIEPYSYHVGRAPEVLGDDAAMASVTSARGESRNAHVA